MITVTLYLRPDCHLCEQAKSDLVSLQTQIPHRLIEVDVESNPDLLKKYFDQIPVVEVGPYRLKAPFTRADLMMTLGAARDSQGHEGQLKRRASTVPQVTGADRLSFWIANHWLLVVNLLFVLYLGLPFLAPVLMKAGATTPANVIYTAYSPLCHELGFRSFFLFGQQAYYPRAAAGIAGVQTFGEATGLNENDLLSARAFKGNEQMGYKVALCQRDVAIYGALILFGIIYSLTGRRLPPLHWSLWLLIGIAPMGLDGFSQLFSQLNLVFLQNLLPFRESTPTLRVLTGFLFGFGTAWFGLPYVEESMRETRELMLKKFSVVDKK